MAHTFLWYDLETFGRDPCWDRIAQFAAIRTNENLEEEGEPVVLFGRISPDYLPDPQACLITGLTPRRTARDGLVEAELAARIHEIMTVPGTCVAGFNSIRFDDEFIRNLFYRTFRDPYRREYAHGNSRWDVLSLVRMAHDLRPEGMEWRYDENGVPRFRLEELTEANGIAHQDAHDARADVRATIALAQLVRARQPRLFEYYLSMRNRDTARRLINLENPQPLLYTSPIFTRPGGCTTAVFPLTVHPQRASEVIVFDLRHNPAELWELPVEELRRRTFTSREDLAGEERIPLTGVAINKVPALSPLAGLTREAADRLQIDRALVEHRAGQLLEHRELATRIRSVYDTAGGSPQTRLYEDPDLGIYRGGFFGNADQLVFEDILRRTPEDLAAAPPEFVDPRGPEMLRRYLGRSYPGALSPQAHAAWVHFCARRLLAPEYEKALDIGSFRRRISVLQERRDTPPRDLTVLQDLMDYSQWLEEHILSQK